MISDRGLVLGMLLGVREASVVGIVFLDHEIPESPVGACIPTRGAT
jgi:hypothetical protein